MNGMKRHYGVIAALAVGVLAVGTRASLAGGPTKTKVDVPTLTCASSTQASITLNVCAPGGTGATGAPAGFSIQWMPAASFTGVWPSSDAAGICTASLSGNASLSRYNLSANQCVLVNIGEFLFDNGASYKDGCAVALACGAQYVFRIFAHATSALTRSDFSPTYTCSTLPCGHVGGCTYTQGYWKTHGPTACNPSLGADLWPTSAIPMMLGNRPYSEAELCSIFNTPAAGNGLIALAHQLIAAKLNIANGADGSAAAADIAAADALIGGLVIPPVGAGSLPSSQTSTLTTALTNFNEGATGPGHCD
jgi:hypothetical protein